MRLDVGNPRKDEEHLVSNREQRRLLAFMTLGLTGAIAVGFRHQLKTLPRIPEQRGVKGDLKEAILQGSVRMGTLFVASVLVRQLAKSRR